jgi:hypothetical protein
MKIKFVTDDYTLINTQGIRFIEKVDGNSYGSNITEYKLRITYKHDILNYHYPTAELRNEQYRKLRELLEKEYGGK